MELVVRIKSGAIFGVVCSILLLAACSKEPVGDAGAESAGGSRPEAGGDISQVKKSSGPSADTVDCLVEALAFPTDKDRLDAILKQPREKIGAAIPPEALLYWGEAPADSVTSPISPSMCQTVANRVVPFDYDAQDVHTESRRRGTALQEFDRAVWTDFSENTFSTFNAVLESRLKVSTEFKPGKKGDFEKTADYEARIASEKSAFEQANRNKKVTMYDVEYVWMGLFGAPRVDLGDSTEASDLYSPDTETLSLKISPLDIPVKIRLTPDQAQKLFAEYDLPGLKSLRPVVVLQLSKGVLVVKEVSLKDYGTFAHLGFERMGFKLDHIPVDYELSRNFVPNL